MLVYNRRIQMVLKPVWVLLCVVAAPFIFAADLIPAAQQNALVERYCAECHSYSVKKGGLSLRNYDAAHPDFALSAMIAAKLKSAHIAAEGVAEPDKTTTEAWIAVTELKSQHADGWSTYVIGGGIDTPVYHASILRDGAPSKSSAVRPVYRLSLSCDTGNLKGEIQLAWSPASINERAFFVSADSGARISQKTAGGESVGNGSDHADALLKVPVPTNSLTVTDVFTDETIVFPFDTMPSDARISLSFCLSASK
jgi:hypothetical protein